MSKKVITISGVKYEIDTEDPNYRKRISPEEYNLKEDSKKVWNKTKEIAKFIKSPEFVKYLVPGVNTKAFAEDAAKNVNNAYAKLKEGKYRQAAGDGFYAIGNILNGVASLAPFTSGISVSGDGIYREIAPGKYIKESGISNSGGFTHYSTDGAQAKQIFTCDELFNHGRKRALRTITSKEYKEALDSKFGSPYSDLLLDSQVKQIQAALLDLGHCPSSPRSIMDSQVTWHGVKTPAGQFRVSSQELKNRFKVDLGVSTDEELLAVLKERLNSKDYEYFKELFSKNSIIRIDDETYNTILSGLNEVNLDLVRRLFTHEFYHTSNGGLAAINDITRHNEQFKVLLANGISEVNKNYYLQPDEIRARALSIRRLHQATGESYEDILNNWHTGKYRPDPNIDDLVEYYDRESLLNYLNNFLKEGGKVNYLDIFKSGSGIHIKKKNKGKFTDYCGGKVTEECILRGKHSSNPTTRKRATFAQNARHFKHQEGGIISNYKSTSLDDEYRSLDIPELEIEIPDYVSSYRRSVRPTVTKKGAPKVTITWDDINITGSPKTVISTGNYSNNPGNIRRSSDVYIGEIPTSGEFKSFKDMAHGFRAMMKTYRTYINNGVKTVGDIINRWAPVGDGNNNPTNYAKTVERLTGLKASDVIDPTNKDQMTKLAYGMSIVETGKTPDMKDIEMGWSLLG